MKLFVGFLSRFSVGSLCQAFCLGYKPMGLYPRQQQELELMLGHGIIALPKKHVLKLVAQTCMTESLQEVP